METQKDMKAMKVAYSITERNGRSFWTRIGVAFINKDGSLNVKLEAVPVSGQLQIRDWEPRDDMPNRGNDTAAAAGAGIAPRANGSGRGKDKDTILTELPF